MFADETKKPTVPLFDDLGNHSRKIQTKAATAQRYFDQGLMFMFAYNHDEAVQAFRQAADLDPGCAMAYWGVALASGMNYNDPSFTTPGRAPPADDRCSTSLGPPQPNVLLWTVDRIVLGGISVHAASV